MCSCSLMTRRPVMDDLNAAAQFNAGDELPLHEGRKVQWVLAEP